MNINIFVIVLLLGIISTVTCQCNETDESSTIIFQFFNCSVTYSKCNNNTVEVTLCLKDGKEIDPTNCMPKCCGTEFEWDTLTS